MTGEDNLNEVVVVNGIKYDVIRLLGHGKGGYSYLILTLFYFQMYNKNMVHDVFVLKRKIYHYSQPNTNIHPYHDLIIL